MAEQVWEVRTVEYFTTRAARADLAAFDQILQAAGTEPPCEGDELPEDA